jgi:hypothetical protein
VNGASRSGSGDRTGSKGTKKSYRMTDSSAISSLSDRHWFRRQGRAVPFGAGKRLIFEWISMPQVRFPEEMALTDTRNYIRILVMERRNSRLGMVRVSKRFVREEYRF